MIPILLGAAAAAAALLAGAPWWLALPAGALFALPGRLAPAAGAVAVAASLPWDASGAIASLLCWAAGTLAALAVAMRLGGTVPWVALPWAAGLVVLAELAWRALPPEGFWSGGDLAVRARLALLGAFALVGLALSYRPRYRNVEEPGAAAGASGTAGAREDTR
jgi:hypothetical protein